MRSFILRSTDAALALSTVAPTETVVSEAAAPVETVAAPEAVKPAPRKRGVIGGLSKPKADKPEAAAKPVKAAGKAKPVPAAATEAKPDAEADRLAKRLADRTAVNALYAVFESDRKSVPVKAMPFKLETSTAHPITRNVSERQCAAIAVAFSAAGKKLATGAKAPRVFERDGVRCAIENGVMRDAISSGLITVIGETPSSEILVLTKRGVSELPGHLGPTAMRAGKLA